MTHAPRRIDAPIDADLAQRPASVGVTAEELAIDARGGSLAAFDALVLRLQGPLFNFLRMRALCDEDAEELAQETFLRAWQQIRRYDSRWRFSTWLFTLGKRQMASRYRRVRRELLSGDPPEHADDSNEPSHLASRREEHDNVWAVAGRVLSVEQRSALWLRYAEELSVREIGRVLGKREPTVRVILFRARERLSKALEPEVTEGRPADVPDPAVEGYAGKVPAGNLAGGR